MDALHHRCPMPASSAFPLAALLLLMGLAPSAQAQDAITAGVVIVDPTVQHLGVRFEVSGDDDLDATCSVRFRRLGDATWRPGLDLVRTHPGLQGEAADRPDDRFAGSLFFLERETSYEVELTLTDPDGGGTTQVVTGTTRREVFEPPAPRLRHVAPGAGGGTGTALDPFLGLQSAADDAAPGDVFLVAPGTYAPFVMRASGLPDNPIVFRGPSDPTRSIDEATWAVIDGGDTDRGIVTLGQNSFDTSWLVLERLVVQNGLWGVDAQNTSHVTLRRSLVRDVGYGYLNRRDNASESHQLVSDCIFLGRNLWPDTGIPSERAIDLRGASNVIRHCRIERFGDGASIQPFTGTAAAHANDIHGNDIAYIVDDPIEIDYNSANTRVWRNRVANSRMGISLAPIYGGPAYVFRNEFFSLESSAYKMNRSPSGLVVIHNTSAKQGNGTSSSSGWQNTLLRNNVLIGTRYAFEEFGLVAGSTDDWDHDALDTPDTPFAKWDDVRYTDLADLRARSGIEANAVSCRLADLVDAPLPASYVDGITPGSYDLTLRPGVPALDAGQPLPNINDPFVTDGRPDCGAHELGAPAPQHGPRPAVLLERVFSGDLRSLDLTTLLQPRQDCAGGVAEASGAIGRTRIPADEATAVHDLPDPGPLRLQGRAGSGDTLAFYELEDFEATACTPGRLLFLGKDTSRAQADLIVRWR
ncbi:MAG: right-handed parallel beta-helix repeat-containing protein [Acidobacteriota bacterium]